MTERNQVRGRPTVPGADKELQHELGSITQDAQQSGEKARSWRIQLVNILILAARVALSVPQAPENRGQKFPDSPDFSGLVRTQL